MTNPGPYELRSRGRTIAVSGGRTGEAPRIVQSIYGTFCTGLFELHDTHGFPLALSIGECVRRGWIPAIADFACDAARAGWSRDRIRAVVREAFADEPAADPAWLRRAEKLLPWLEHGAGEKERT